MSSIGTLPFDSHITKAYCCTLSGLFIQETRVEWRGCERKMFQPSFCSPLLPSRSPLRVPFPRRVENPGRPGPDHLGGVGGGAAAGLPVACPQADVGTRGKNGQTREIQISPSLGPFPAFALD